MHKYIIERTADFALASIIFPFFIAHSMVLMLFIGLALIGGTLGLSVSLLAEYLLSKGSLRDTFEYWLFKILAFIFVLFVCSMIYWEYVRPLRPIIHRYAPDHIHIDWR